MFKFFKKGNKMSVKVKIVNENDTGLPAYQVAGSAGVDLFSNEDILMEPGRQYVIDTGIRVLIPEGFELQIRSRSGLTAKHGVFVLNSPGTIDSGYIGPLKVILFNSGKFSFTVEKGMRIAQAVLNRFEKIEWETVDELEETERGSGGFGSSGLK